MFLMMLASVHGCQTGFHLLDTSHKQPPCDGTQCTVGSMERCVRFAGHNSSHSVVHLVNAVDDGRTNVGRLFDINSFILYPKNNSRTYRGHNISIYLCRIKSHQKWTKSATKGEKTDKNTLLSLKKLTYVRSLLEF